MNTVPRAVLRVELAGYGDWLRRDAALHVFVACYALVGLLLGIAAGVPHKFVPLAYLRFFPVLLAVGIGVGLYALASGAPFDAIRAALRRVSSPQNLAALSLFASMCVFMGVFSSIKTMLPDVVSFFADPTLADLDSQLHGQDPWRYTVAWLAPWLTRVLEPMYFGLWGVLLPWSMLAALLAPRLEPVRKQYVWTVLLVWTLLGNVLAAAAMSAGPVYYQLVTGDGRFSGLVDYVARNTVAQQWGQALLWQSYVFGLAGAGSGISAFPSLHVANATLFVLLAARWNRWLLAAATAFCAVILVGSVHLGWHYAVDGYFSILATVLIWLGVGRLLRAVASRARNTHVNARTALEMTTSTTAARSATVIGKCGASASRAKRLTR